MIAVRPATEEDADLLLAWANDPVTRAAGSHPSPIDPASHRRWLVDRLASAGSRLLVGFEGDRPIGQVRLDADDEGRVEVGIAVAAEARGRGIGRALLEAGLAAGLADPDLAVEAFVARIRPDNAPSLALFTGAGFHAVGTDEEADLPYLVYERAAG